MKFEKLRQKIFIKETEILMTLPLVGHHITKKYQTYSLIRCNRKESLSMTLKLKVSLNDTKTKSQTYFEKFFKIKRSNGNLYTL